MQNQDDLVGENGLVIVGKMTRGGSEEANKSKAQWYSNIKIKKLARNGGPTCNPGITKVEGGRAILCYILILVPAWAK